MSTKSPFWTEMAYEVNVLGRGGKWEERQRGWKGESTRRKWLPAVWPGTSAG